MKGRPQAGEYGAHAEADIARVEGDDAVEALARQAREVEELFGNLSEPDIAGLRYAPGKWTPKEILGHLIDDERIHPYGPHGNRLTRLAAPKHGSKQRMHT